MPDFAIEASHYGPVAGIDEVGRGPLAGPVVAAAVVLDPANLPQGANDSKKLTALRRQRLHEIIMRTAMVGIGSATVDEIDKLNIRRATHLAMQRAFAALGTVPDLVLVDGNDAPDIPCVTRTIVGGDGLSLSIASASIVAKVTRDALMVELDGQHPEYGWCRNKGYGTAEHTAALARYGVTAHHRKSFAPVYQILCLGNPADSILTD